MEKSVFSAGNGDGGREKPACSALPGEILSVARQIRELVEARRLILFSRKTGVSGSLSSFKLCVIPGQLDREEAERLIYREVDCPVPFDVVIYTPGQWEQALSLPDSFASQISRTGCDLDG